ncbi:hypothetical protein CYMTET_8963 [Cymbomonas tetramitiformis]|uniref:Uncharacterized protein n=1 Tax=Cymbomonas tetramitiformis TaxID=36881 RepID=A0AAE0FVD6_9CHLO|nr:hypothetical protein CYMTET_25028 [Cymbomonas tetramitiformis]KAK3283335.1 hypothetical protein CYMTET_8963 [Cymbomonas tetramitiformis]|eukprot:gene4089-5065_t
MAKGCSLRRQSRPRATSLRAASDAASTKDVPNSHVSLSTVTLGIATLALAVVNRIFYKAALSCPVGEYVFFLAQLCTFAYIVIYFVALGLRYQQGIVTRAMLAVPKAAFVRIGLMEALSLVFGLVAARGLPGTLLPVLSQTLIVWNLSVTAALLGRRYSALQLSGAALVASGAAVCAAFSQGGVGLGGVDSRVLLNSLFFIASMAPIAFSAVGKEKLFEDGRQRFGGTGLDLFVVNSFSSLFQGIFVLCFLPLLASLKGIGFLQLPTYLQQGWAALYSAPTLPLLYVAANLSFNVTILNFLKATGSVAVTLTMSLAVPLTVFAFTLPLPFLGAPPTVNGPFIGGVFVLLAGLLLWNAKILIPRKEANNVEEPESS